GVSGVISAANSLVGTTANDYVGLEGGRVSNGNYVAVSPHWHNGAFIDAGAATWVSSATGLTGTVSTANSLVGSATSTSLQQSVADDSVNCRFYVTFISDGGGRVRVGPPPSPVIASAADIPDDQGGWLRLTYDRSNLEDMPCASQVASYGVWRHIPGTVANVGEESPSWTSSLRLDARRAEQQRLRDDFSPDYSVWETAGHLCLKARGLQPDDAF